MTIREHFKRAQNWSEYGLSGILVAAALGMHFLFPKLHVSSFMLAGLALAALVGVPVYIAMHRANRCPRCNVDLLNLRGKTISAWGSAWGSDRRRFWEAWDACPNCQLSFDAPWEKAKG